MDNQNSNFLNTSISRPVRVIILIVLLALAVVIGYSLGKTTPQIATKVTTTKTVTPAVVPAPVATTTTTPAATTTSDPTADWKTYTNSDYNLSFKYPNTWSDASVSKETKGVDPVNFSDTFLNFPTGVQTDDVTKGVSVYLSSISDINASNSKDQLANLRSVYTSKKISKVTSNDYPGNINAGTIAMTTPQYIETANGIYRGVYYYGNLGQDDPAKEGENEKLNDLFIFLTDNKNQVVEFIIGAGSNSNYTATPCTIKSTGHPGCVRSDELVNDFGTIYKNLINTLASK